MWSMFVAVLFVAAVVAADPRTCKSCLVKGGLNDCYRNQSIQTCATDPGSLGTTHCYTAMGKNEKSKTVFARGCINCTSKVEACAAIKTSVKQRFDFALQDCGIECCTTDNCTTETPRLTSDGPSHCMSCVANEWEKCDRKAKIVSCRNGESYCYSAIAALKGIFLKSLSRVVQGCMADMCTDKKKACDFVERKLGGKDLQLNWAKCEVDCCTTNNCNANTRPSLPKKDDNTSGGGSKRCISCFGSSWEGCDSRYESESCELSYCYSGIGTYNTKSDFGLTGMFRGCMSDICTDKVKACEYINTRTKSSEVYFNVTTCEIDCCTTDNCNANTRPTQRTPSTQHSNSHHGNPSGLAVIVVLSLGLLSAL